MSVGYQRGIRLNGIAPKSLEAPREQVFKIRKRHKQGFPAEEGERLTQPLDT
jgi:hypothetical protein